MAIFARARTIQEASDGGITGWFSKFFDPLAANIPPQSFAPFTCSATPNAFSPTGMGGTESNLLGGIGSLSNFNLYYIRPSDDIGSLQQSYAGSYLGGCGDRGSAWHGRGLFPVPTQWQLPPSFGTPSQCFPATGRRTRARLVLPDRGTTS